MTSQRRLSDPPPRRIIRPDQVDNLGEALIALTEEVWVLTDRVMVQEALLEAKGVMTKDEIDRAEPSADLEKALAERRERLIERIERALRGVSD